MSKSVFCKDEGNVKGKACKGEVNKRKCACFGSMKDEGRYACMCLYACVGMPVCLYFFYYYAGL